MSTPNFDTYENPNTIYTPVTMASRVVAHPISFPSDGSIMIDDWLDRNKGVAIANGWKLNKLPTILLAFMDGHSTAQLDIQFPFLGNWTVQFGRNWT